MLTEHLIGCVVSSGPWLASWSWGAGYHYGHLVLTADRGCWRGSGARRQQPMKAMPSGSWRMHLQRSARLRTSLQYHLLPLCSFPLPICARPLISQRIKKKIGMVQGKRIRNLWAAPSSAWFTVSDWELQCPGLPLTPLLKVVTRCQPMGLCILLYHTVEI